MSSINFTNFSQSIKPMSQEYSTYSAEQCADWCINQSILIEYNIEMSAVLFVAIALISLLGSEALREMGHVKLADNLATVSTIALYIFFFIYFIVIRMGLYHYGF